MKKLIVGLVVIALVILTTTTAFASGDGVCEDDGQGICTQQCSGDGEGQMNRWQHKAQKISQWAEPAMGTGRESASQYQWGKGAN
ncbi:MAG: hypothetical protein HN929_09080 [Chloroflexi bacterium]|jgi:hypothetical protein|nr:hypothetical protein [Chloroflexota bacterium]MBT7081602.1 hypothetical protein [Chloroflexota bacterium]MBT7290070.1 hypothetical protein [Chloroflexota bacterium]